MNEITKLIIDATTKIMKDICTKKLVNEAEQGLWASELWDILADSGMITVAIPEERGGNGGGYADAFNILRLAGKYAAPIPLAETFLGNWLLNQLGGEISDEPLTFAYPNKNQLFRFQKNGEGWVVSGKARAIPWARFAKTILIFGQTESEHVVALIKKEHGHIELGQNLAGEARDTITLDHTFIKDCQVIPIEFEHVSNQLWHSGALTRIVLMAGATERVLELTKTYTTERVQFGRPIHRFQAIQQQLAILAGEYAAAGIAADCAVDAFKPGFQSKDIAMAKIRINEAAGKAAAIAHQVHGAIGFTHEHILHQYTRRLWAWRDEYGTETEWGNQLAHQIVENGQAGLWSFLTDKKSIGRIIEKKESV
ncbi:acyl-CoA dehydrogenase family protein [Peribacillus glennii]|uniref:Acyl-CoA dehydrogenase n=1 Tax=Peribacillus glennii TaxID=2303991 RepID=A0A372LHP0_9BACI|nr:acyl-CoA dehydrogenase family protein [Peribacillus glennii]RFU65126.1 acyl-CoA dehydrogenase [Peribacillus glennii]